MDGVFACALYDGYENKLYLARDPFGVRPMYHGYTNCGDFCFASELKSVDKLCRSGRVYQFPPGKVATIIFSENTQKIYSKFENLLRLQIVEIRTSKRFKHRIVY